MTNYGAGCPAILAIHELQEGMNPSYMPEWVGTFRYGVNDCDTVPVRTCAPNRIQAEANFRAWNRRERNRGMALVSVSPLYPFMA